MELVESAATREFLGYSVSTPDGPKAFGNNLERAIGEAFEQNHLTVLRNWRVNDNWFQGPYLRSFQTQTQNPQNSFTTKIPLLDHKKLLQDTLAYSDCADFMSRLISKAGELSAEANDPISTDVMKLYAMVNRQSRGGFHLNHSGPLYGYFKGYEKLEQVAGGGGASWGNWRANNVTIWIPEQEIFANAASQTFAAVPFEYAQRSLHELFHVAGKNRTYKEQEMEKAAGFLEPGLSLTQAIRKHCIPREFWPGGRL
jgi:hypothetical protein